MPIIVNNQVYYSPVVIITFSEVFDRTVPSTDLFPFPWNPYLKTDGTSLFIFFLFKIFEVTEIFAEIVLSETSVTWW